MGTVSSTVSGTSFVSGSLVLVNSSGSIFPVSSLNGTIAVPITSSSGVIFQETTAQASPTAGQGQTPQGTQDTMSSSVSPRPSQGQASSPGPSPTAQASSPAKAPSSQQPSGQPASGQQSSGNANSPASGNQASPSGNQQAASTTQVKVVSGSNSSPTGTSTILDHQSVETTLAQPVSSTLFSNGQSLVVTPSLVTSLSTSTAPDGGFLTFTHIAANPTGFLTTNGNLSGSSFFDNTAATAGVFTAVGIVAGILMVGGCLIIRRHRRAASQRRWLDGMKPYDDTKEDPFSDNAPAGIMQSVNVEHDGRSTLVGSGSRRNTLTDERLVDPQNVAFSGGHYRSNSTSRASHYRTSSTGHDGIFGTVGNPNPPPTAGGNPFESEKDFGNSISGRSTPSVYPPSDTDSLRQVVVDMQSVARPILPSEPPPAPVAPPRPARSLLRDARKPPELLYVTPPSSSHGSTPSPVTPILKDIDEDHELRSVSSVEEMVHRPSLLSVRPLPSRDGNGNPISY